jgi:hypothetical protein
MRLLAESGEPLPPADRPTLRRFRHLVQDLGGDLYLAFAAADLVGLVHVTYTRQLAETTRAELRRLVVSDSATGGPAEALIEFVAARARKRGCDALLWPRPAGRDENLGRPAPPGFANWGRCYILNLVQEDARP